MLCGKFPSRSSLLLAAAVIKWPRPATLSLPWFITIHTHTHSHTHWPDISFVISVCLAYQIPKNLQNFVAHISGKWNLQIVLSLDCPATDWMKDLWQPMTSNRYFHCTQTSIELITFILIMTNWAWGWTNTIFVDGKQQEGMESIFI